ncbi:MAG: hypothetical protein ACYTEG_14775 [Planctomycetota bacterium]|jgi:uncharacterized protein (DUF305 family)
MRRFTATLAIFLLLACQGSGETEGGVKQYRAWCWSESKPLGDWSTDKDAAQAQVDAHVKMIPHHRAAVKVWTGPLQSAAK